MRRATKRDPILARTHAQRQRHANQRLHQETEHHREGGAMADTLEKAVSAHGRTLSYRRRDAYRVIVRPGGAPLYRTPSRRAAPRQARLITATALR